MPWYLQVALEQALTILSWYENLPREDQPPEHLWEDGQGLEQWWAGLEEKRQDRAGRTPDEDEAPTEMASNDLARALKGG